MKKGELKLFIDSSSNQKTIVRLGNRELVQKVSVWRSQVVLPMIAKLLKAKRAELKDITKIEVVAEAGKQGSFTGLRVGKAIANALNFALGLDSPAPL